jgi:hypothetical protein
MKQIDRVKLLFKLDRDENGYPPVDWESMWAISVSSDEFEIDNIPFYVRGISCGDVVRAKRSDAGEWLYVELIEASQNSTVRVFVSSPSEASFYIDSLVTMGCDCERSNITRLFTVHVPNGCALKPILEFLSKAESEGKLEYEEGAIRQ